MASAVVARTMHTCRCLFGGSRRLPCVTLRQTSSSSKDPTDLESRDHWVAAADEGRTLILYHPERPFPYEHSVPIPRQQALINEGDSVLKVQHRLEVLEKDLLEEKTFPQLKLAKLLHTRKDKFTPRYPENLYRRFRVKNPPKGRDGL